jgi:hypothetical protein
VQDRSTMLENHYITPQSDVSIMHTNTRIEPAS